MLENQAVDRYKVGQQLGEGGMAYVYGAYDNLLHCTVALKFLKESCAQSPSRLSRFYEEAYIMGSLEHPGVPAVYDLGVDPIGRHYYSMNRIDGMSLSEIFSRRKKSQLTDYTVMNRLVRLFITICETVGYAHRHGVVHRDLKPSNIMVDHFDNPYVMDWGVAKRLNQSQQVLVEDCENFTTSDKQKFLTESGTILGTPGYLSPEQASGDSDLVSPQSDVFSLGVILYEILSARLPFEGKDDESMIAKVPLQIPKEPKAFNLIVPKELSAICMKALNKEQNFRYETAAELASDLKNFQDHFPTIAAPPNFIDRTLKWGQRNPAKTGAILSSLFILLFVVGGFSWQVWERYRIGTQLHALVEECRPKIVTLEKKLENLIDALPLAEVQTRQEFEKKISQARMALIFEIMSHIKRLSRELGFSSQSPPDYVLREIRVFDKKVITLLKDQGEEEAAKLYAATILTGKDGIGLINQTDSNTFDFNSDLTQD